MNQSTLDIKLESAQDPLTGDIRLFLTIPQLLTRTDGEFKWRIIQAIVLALTDKETYGSADTEEGLQELQRKLNVTHQ